MTLSKFFSVSQNFPDTQRMPVLFVGHGSPMNALTKNTTTLGWEKLGKEIPTPKAILSISAHWLTEGTFVHISANPKTIHDYWGFPKELYEITYPAPGSPEGAFMVKSALGESRIFDDADWGLDHGTWVVLLHMFPDATIPVFQMSIDVRLSHREHYNLGKMLSSLREKGILIIGSGNIVHNLGKIDWEENAPPSDWATGFDNTVAELIEQHEHDRLINYDGLGHNALLAIPTPDHYWPLLYILGLQTTKEDAHFPVTGIAHGSISMRTVYIH